MPSDTIQIALNAENWKRLSEIGFFIALLGLMSLVGIALLYMRSQVKAKKIELALDSKRLDAELKREEMERITRDILNNLLKDLGQMQVKSQSQQETFQNTVLGLFDKFSIKDEARTQQLMAVSDELRTSVADQRSASAAFMQGVVADHQGFSTDLNLIKTQISGIPTRDQIKEDMAQALTLALVDIRKHIEEKGQQWVNDGRLLADIRDKLSRIEVAAKFINKDVPPAAA